LDVMVMDFDNIGRNELIGRIQLAGILNFSIRISKYKLLCLNSIDRFIFKVLNC